MAIMHYRNNELYINHFTYRKGNWNIYGILQSTISMCHRAPQDAHTGEPHYSLAPTMVLRNWINGGAVVQGGTNEV